MSTVLEALFRSENALLESPTGTGKTLCLLCSTLAWQRELARRINSADVPIQKDNTLNSSSVEESSSSQSQSQSQPQPGTSTKPIAAQRPPTIIYASRTHSQLSQVVRELRNTRYRPKHTVLGSREQMCVNPKVKKAGSSAFTINHDCSKLGKDRKCRFKNRLEGFKPPSSESSGNGTQPVMDLEDLVSMGHKHKVCPFYHTRSNVGDAELVLVPYNYLFDKDARATTLAEIQWDNSIVIFDEAHNLESFASDSASFDLTASDIAGCVLETHRALGFKEAFPTQCAHVKQDNICRIKALFLNLEEYILNLPNRQAYPGDFMIEVLEKGASITYANHQLFVNEVRKITEIFLEVGGGAKGTPRLEHFLQCIKCVFGEPTEARCLAKSSSYRVHVSPKTSPTTKGGGGKAGTVSRTVSYWCFAPAEAMHQLSNLNIRSILVTSGTLSPLESYAMELGLEFPHRLENPHIIPNDSIHVRVVGKGVSGKVLSSSYERRQDPEYFRELGNTLVSLSKVVPGGMLVFFPSYGVMQACIESWGGPVHRSSASYKTNNFFSARRPQDNSQTSRYSFEYVPPNTFSSAPMAATIWKRLLGTKAVVLEPKSTSDLPDAISEFRRFLSMPKSTGCTLFGVCRGKISEGIDFANEQCRAVVITGLPFAPSFDPKVKMKKEFLDQNRTSKKIKATGDGGFSGQETAVLSSLSGQEWYTQQAHRAVNQAIGRVIRNRNDYGSVLLLDERFGQPQNIQGLSKWVRPHVEAQVGVGQTISSLVSFFRNAERKAQIEETKIPSFSAVNDVSAVFSKAKQDDLGEQDAEDVLEEVTKVVVIRKEKDLSSSNQELSSADFISPGQILGKVDVSGSMERKCSNVQSTGITNGDENNASARNGIHNLYDQNGSHSEGITMPHQAKRDPDSSAPSNKKRIPDTVSQSSSNAASRFFALIQAHLDPADISVIKKSIVAMKGFGERNETKAYLLAGRKIVLAVLPLVTLKEGRGPGTLEVFDLLFQLLPKKYRATLEKMAMADVFAESVLGLELMRYLSADVFQSFRVSVPSFLWNVWYNTKDERIVVKPFKLKLYQDIMALFSGVEEKFATKAMRLLSDMVPSVFASPLNALLESFRASRNIARMKKNEKANVGEASIQIERFRPGPKQPAILEDEGAELAAKVAPNDLNGPGVHAKTKPGVPYKPGQPHKKRLSASSVNMDSDSLSRPKSKFKKLLQSSEQETFLGNEVERKNKKKKIVSDAPNSLSCPICEKHVSKVCRWHRALLASAERATTYNTMSFLTPLPPPVSCCALAISFTVWAHMLRTLLDFLA